MKEETEKLPKKSKTTKVRIPIKWEKIGDQEYRSKTFCGWLVQAIDDCGNACMTFVPDEHWAWQV